MATAAFYAMKEQEEKQELALARAKAPYQPGGAFGKGVEAGLERGRVKATASGMQSLVSAGLAGTTMAAGLGKKYEEEVAAPIRLRVEGQRAQALSGIEMMWAEMMQRIVEADKQRKFLAEQGAAGRQAQLTLGQPPAMQPSARHGPSASQFPSLYGADEGGMPPVPSWTGEGGGASTGYGGASGYKPGTTFGPSLRTPVSSLPTQAPAPTSGGFEFSPPSSYYGGVSAMRDPWLVGQK